MKTYLSFAGINTLAGALFSLVLFFTGLQTENLATGQYVQYLGLVIFGVILFLGIRDARDKKPADQAFTYGNGLVAGIMIGLFTGLFMGVYNAIHFSLLNPDFSQYMIDFIRPQLQAKNVPDNAIESLVKFYNIMFSPAGMAVMTFLSWSFWGLIMGLVMAAFTRRAAPALAEPAGLPPAQA